jgi:hypothetical protein
MNETPANSLPERLKTIKDILVFIRKYQAFFEASFCVNGEFTDWVNSLEKTPENDHFISQIKFFSTQLMSILNENEHLDIRKDPKTLGSGGAQLDPIACFIDAILGVELVWRETISKNTQANPINIEQDNEPHLTAFVERRNNDILYIMVDMCAKLETHLAYWLLAIEPLIDMWYQSKNIESNSNAEAEVLKDITEDPQIQNHIQNKLKKTALAKLAADSMQSLFAEGQHSNHYQKSAQLEASGNSSRPQLNCEESLHTQDENDSDEESSEERPRKRQKLTGEFNASGEIVSQNRL